MASHPRASRSWLLWAVAVTGIAVLIGVLILSLASTRLEPSALRLFLLGWIVIPYAVGGALAWWRRPASRLGPLMLLTAFVMGLVPLQWSSQPLPYSVGHLLDMVPAAVFLHTFLAFPTGRLHDRKERVLVASTYATTLGLQVVKVVLGINPDSVFSVLDNAAISSFVEGVQLSLVAVCLLLGVFLLYRRRSGGSRARRPAALVVDAFGLALVMLAALYLGGLFAWPFVEVIRLVTFAALGLAPIAFLFALLDLQLARGEVSGLLVELRADPTADLQAPMARALRDPSLRLSYWLPEFAGWADQAGAPVPVPAADERRAVRLLDRDGAPMAALTFDRSLEDEHELLDAVMAAAAIALENGRLRAELRARLAELQGSRVRVLEAGRQERQRLERDLHDGAQVRLVALSMELDLMGGDPAADPALRARLRNAKDEVRASLAELRDVGLAGRLPAGAESTGTDAALAALTGRVQLLEGSTRTVEEVVAELWAASAPVDEQSGSGDGDAGKA
jgi:signal transduction histidine kinase